VAVWSKLLTGIARLHAKTSRRGAAVLPPTLPPNYPGLGGKPRDTPNCKNRQTRGAGHEAPCAVLGGLDRVPRFGTCSPPPRGAPAVLKAVSCLPPRPVARFPGRSPRFPGNGFQSSNHGTFPKWNSNRRRMRLDHPRRDRGGHTERAEPLRPLGVRPAGQVIIIGLTNHFLERNLSSGRFALPHGHAGIVQSPQ
jgi:hypothetical protein